MSIELLPGITPDVLSRPLDVYRNLAPGAAERGRVWSLRIPGATVIGYADGCAMLDAVAVVSESSVLAYQQARGARHANGRKRNVFAWLRGVVVDDVESTDTGERITFRPLESTTFFLAAVGPDAPVHRAARVTFTSKGTALAEGIA
jgi:hypothetical protein